jgi:hypothetical protein
MRFHLEETKNELSVEKLHLRFFHFCICLEFHVSSSYFIITTLRKGERYEKFIFYKKCSSKSVCGCKPFRGLGIAPCYSTQDEDDTNKNSHN